MSLLRERYPAPADRSAQALTVKLITGSEVPADLLARTTTLAGGGPFGRALWWGSWWRHLRPRRSELFLLTVSQGDELIGLAPWYTQRAFDYGRIVRFLGDGRACSDYATILAAPQRRAEVWREITHWVAAEAGTSWDAFILDGVSAADEGLQEFCQQIGQQDIVVDQRPVANTWRLTLPENWEAYVELFSKQHRNRLRRTKREMLDSGRAVLHRVTSPADFEHGFEIQCRFHQLRRNSLGDEGCFADPQFETFLREATERFLRQGALRLQWTEVDGEPVAFDSGYVEQEGVFAYQTGFDPAKSDLSPGRLHFQASIMKAIEEGYRFFDFLRGDEPYKAHFRATPIPVLETRLISPRIRPRLGHRCWKFQQRVKARVRARSERKSSSRLRFLRALLPGSADRAPTPAAVQTMPRHTFAAVYSRYGVVSAAKGLAYRVARRLCRLQIGHVLTLELADLSPTPPPLTGLEYRWLAADEVRVFAVDPANDLDPSLAARLENGRNYCLAAFDGARLANYSWYALESIEAEHSLGIGLALPTGTVYLYKAYTHPDFRGRSVYHAALQHAAQFFAQRGISRLIALVEFGNWASVRSHEKLGCRHAGKTLKFGRPPVAFERFPQVAEALGIRFGGK